jgi:hypothetical protein
MFIYCIYILPLSHDKVNSFLMYFKTKSCLASIDLPFNRELNLCDIRD